MKLRKILAVLLAAMMTLTFAVSAQAADAQETTTMNIVLDWYPNAVHTFLYEAIDKGYFAEEGIELNIITPAETVDAINFVATGKAEIGLTYPVEIVQAHEAGMPVKALAAVAQKALECMCSLKSNEAITADLSCLAGKKIGYSGIAVAKAIVETVTASYGLTPDDYELINVGFDLVTSLTTGNVDLAVGTFINDEVVTMENSGYPLNVYIEQEYGIPELYGLVMAVNSEDYEARPELYEGFLRACEKGFADMKSDKEGSMAIIMNEMNSLDNPLDEVQQSQSYDILIPRMETEDASFLSMSQATWQEVVEWMAATAQIEAGFDAAELVIQ